MLASAVPRNNEIQGLIELGLDLQWLSNNPMREALRLTHSDSGRHLASKLDAQLTNLAVCYRHYARLLSQANESKENNDSDAIKTLLKQLLKFKYQLFRLTIQAARQGLDDVDENYLARLNKLESDINSYLERPQSAKHLERIAHWNFISTIVYYGTIVASYMTKGLQGFLHSLPTILSNLGRVFPPIIIALDAAKNIFDLVYSYATRSHLAKMEMTRGQHLASAPLYSKGYYLRQAGNAIALALNVFTLLIFTGALFTTPFGWALSAAVVASEWVSSCVIPAWQARKNWKRLQDKANETLIDPQLIDQEIETHKQARDNPVDSVTGARLTNAAAHREINRINREINRLLGLKKDFNETSERVQLAKKNYQTKRADALWGFCSIAGSILFACGFLCPPLFIPGVALLLASPIRSIYNWLADKIAKHRKKSETGETAEEPAPSAAQTLHIQKALGIVNTIEAKRAHSESPRSSNGGSRPSSSPSTPRSYSPSLRLLGDSGHSSPSIELAEIKTSQIQLRC